MLIMGAEGKTGYKSLYVSQPCRKLVLLFQFFFQNQQRDIKEVKGCSSVLNSLLSILDRTQGSIPAEMEDVVQHWTSMNRY